MVGYKISSATTTELYEHLAACDDNFIPPLSPRIAMREYAEKIAEHSITFEAWQKTVLVGLIAAYVNDPHNKTAFITNVSVVKEYMGKGIASELMERLIDYLAEKKFTGISLEVHKTNQQAIQFYKKFNFEQDGSREDFLIMKKDQVGPFNLKKH